jgi:hypothetical protein
MAKRRARPDVFSAEKKTSTPVPPPRDPYEAWAAEVARLRKAAARRRAGWRVSTPVVDGVEGARIVRRATDGEALDAALARAMDAELKNALERGPDWNAWWRAAAGEEIARQSRAMSFRNGFLTVAVDSAPLRAELETFRREALVETLSAFCGDGLTLRDIRFTSTGKRNRDG